MFKHEKMLFHPVAVEKANPQYAALLQEQLGGANGELKAAMQYMSQSFRIKDQEIKDLFLDIAAEELGQHPSASPGRVFDKAQSFIDDVARFGAESADMAPGILPKMDTIGSALRSA